MLRLRAQHPAERLPWAFPGVRGWLSRSRAKRIRTWRGTGHDVRCSWRAIAQMAHDRWGPDTPWGWPEWNQLAGVDLCDEAARVLGFDMATKEPGEFYRRRP